MPFTFSHPAIVLPLTFLSNKWYSLTGLVIGSLTPDFEYFLRMKIKSNYSHSLGGLFWFDIPLGIIIAFLYHNFVRNSLIDNLPIALKSRFSIFKQLDWNSYFFKNWLIILISILIGASSHIFWDSFTHEHGFFVQYLHLSKHEVDFIGMKIPLFKILQHLSSFIGAIVIVYSIYRLPKNNQLNNYMNMKYWLLVFSISILIVLIKILLYPNTIQVGNLIVTCITVGIISLIISPLILKKQIR